ncbi:MAG: ChaN family lipoprotein [Sulfuritalea sp.]|nr:ChaN family lipoprotein [Sulfuritalea sp.]MDP1984129.1 ChaN family lipoprotein [Sulfuritalea sp.]
MSFFKPGALRRLRPACLALLLAGCTLIPPGTLRDTEHPLAGRLWDVAAQTFTDETELLRRAASAEALLLGETHDNPEHHRLQAKVLQARLAAGARPALLMEQFDVGQQAAIDEARKAGKDPAALMRGWDGTLYQPLVALADRAQLPLRAANLPRDTTRPIVREGFATLAVGEQRRLGLLAVWDETREAYMAGLIEASHCGMISPQTRDGLVRAQRLRDATLADSALDQLDQGVVFILGRGHARRDVAVPRYLEARRPGTRVLSVGFVEVGAGMTAPTQYETERIGGIAPFDILWFTPRAERTDPCLAYGK